MPAKSLYLLLASRAKRSTIARSYTIALSYVTVLNDCSGRGKRTGLMFQKMSRRTKGLIDLLLAPYCAPLWLRRVTRGGRFLGFPRTALRATGEFQKRSAMADDLDFDAVEQLLDNADAGNELQSRDNF